MSNLASAIEPPKFGTSGVLPFSLWKGLVINYVEALKLTEGAAKLVLFRLLEGKALDILVTIPKISDLKLEDQLAALEVRLTSKRDEREWRMRFHALEPGQEQSPRLFADQLEKIALNAFPEEKERVRNVLEKFTASVKLPADVSRAAFIQADKETLEEAINFIESWRVAERIANKQTASITERVCNLALNESSPNANLAAARQFPNVANDVRCFFCKEVGHLRTKCPKLEKLTCFRCGGKGHLARSCQSGNDRGAPFYNPGPVGVPDRGPHREARNRGSNYNDDHRFQPK